MMVIALFALFVSVFSVWLLLLIDIASRHVDLRRGFAAAWPWTLLMKRDLDLSTYRQPNQANRQGWIINNLFHIYKPKSTQLAFITNRTAAKRFSKMPIGGVASVQSRFKSSRVDL